ncbi:hypothetical protein BD410DRAFT_712625 [Rickenella mellea]|uniref:F-box domain-containing protein n=1 Tax=Rickenella mellea TaxID=50990 RepID=A0A4Y7QKM5_9AGAM|nr:hypothetical protein BD410DRAFT_712625 [Rickenella mellea]
MFSLLRDPDTTNLVLEFILDTPNGRRSVARLARTCKALQEPSLAVLWKELDSLNPLLYTMPTHLFKRAKRPGLGFTKAPEEGDWNRLLLYGQRVKRLAYNETAGNVHPSIFTAIEDINSEDYLLPNLRALSWRADTPDGLERSLLFLTPEIQSLTVEFGSRIPQGDIQEFLTEATANTSLTELSITSAARLPSNLTTLLRSQESLERVSLMAPGALSPSIGGWLSALPSLQSLQIDVTGRSDAAISAFFDHSSNSGTSSPDGIRTPDSGVFSGDELDSSSWSRSMDKPVMVDWSSMWKGYQQLRNLKLTGDATSCTTFLGRIGSPIQSLELVIDDPEEESDWQELCTTIHRRFRNTLQSWQVSATGASRFSDLVRSTARGDISYRRLSLDGLRSLPYLVRLEIDLPESAIFHDSDMLHVATACPNLEILKLCSVSRWPSAYGPPKLTLAGLAPLTAWCRRLHTLSIPVHAVESADERVFNWELSSPSLVRLHVGHSWVREPFNAAILLSHLAPSLESLKWFHEKNRPGYVEANNVAWQKVSDILSPLQRLRQQERQQARALVHAQSLVQAQVQPTVVPVPTAEKSVDATVHVVTESRGVLAKPSTEDVAVLASPVVSHRSTHTAQTVRSLEVDATRPTKHQEVDAVTPVHESNATGLARRKSVDQLDFDEKASYVPHTGAVFSAVGDTLSTLYQTVRSVSPPFILRLIDVFSIFSPSSLRTPVLSKITPVCQ